MRFRLHGGDLHVHGCPQHTGGCEYFSDHAVAWMIGSREAATEQLLTYRKAIMARIAALNVVLVFIDKALVRLGELRPVA